MAVEEIQRAYERGQAYMRGDGVGQNPEEAAKWFEEAARHGHVPSMHTLGDMYAEGRGLSKSLSEAARWYEEAAKHGDLRARERLEALETKGVTPPQRRLIDGKKWNRRRITPDLLVGRSRVVLGLHRRSRKAWRRKCLGWAGWLLGLSVIWPAMALLGGARLGDEEMLAPMFLFWTLVACAPFAAAAGWIETYLRFDRQAGTMTIYRFTPLGVWRKVRPLAALGRIEQCSSYIRFDSATSHVRQESPLLSVWFRTPEGKRLATIHLDNVLGSREKIGVLGQVLAVPVEELPPRKPWGF